MAERNKFEKFSDCLTRLGVSDADKEHIANAEISEVEEMVVLGQRQFAEMLERLSKKKVPVGEDPVSIGYIVANRLEAFCMWAEYRKRRGQTYDPDDFDEEVLLIWNQRVKELGDVAKDKTEVKAPEALKDQTKWPAFKANFQGYLRVTRSVFNGAPLDYVIRENTIVSDDALASGYDTIDQDMVATLGHRGSEYHTDNQKVWMLLKPLVVESPAWSFIRKWDKTSNGRDGWLALTAQMEGKTAKFSRKDVAYNILNSTKYTGHGKLTFENFVGKYQEAYTILEEEGEAVAESKKVKDLLNSITDKTLETAKQMIYLDNDRLESFEGTHQFLSTIAATNKSNKPHATISTVKKTPPKKKQKRDKADDDKDDKKPSGVPIHAGTYSSKDYKKLKPFERTEVRRLRDEEKARGCAAVATSPIEKQPEESKPTEAIVKKLQFGRAAHKNAAPKTE